MPFKTAKIIVFDPMMCKEKVYGGKDLGTSLQRELPRQLACSITVWLYQFTV